MKIFLLFIVCSISTLTAFSQAIVSSAYSSSGEVDLRGNPLTSKPFEAEGSPYLNTHWGKGMVKLKSGQWHRDVSLQFNLETNTLFFERAGMSFSFVDTVVEFFIAYEEEGESHAYIYRAGFPAVDKQQGADFYEVVVDGKNVQLLKFNDKIITAKAQYGQENRKEYKMIEQWYVFDVKKGLMLKIKKDIPSIRKALPAYSDSINAFMQKGKKHLQNTEDLKALFAFIESR